MAPGQHSLILINNVDQLTPTETDRPTPETGGHVMPDDQTAETAQDQQQQEPQNDQGQQQQDRPEPKPTETVEFWRTKARDQEKRAKENAAAAKRLADLEDAQKTETQRLSDKITRAEERATKAEQDLLRFKIASRFKITEEDADLFLTGTDEDTLTRQAERLAARESENQRQQQHGFRSGEGRGTQQTGDPDLAFASQLFRGRD